MGDCGPAHPGQNRERKPDYDIDSVLPHKRAGRTGETCAQHKQREQAQDADAPDRPNPAHRESGDRASQKKISGDLDRSGGMAARSSESEVMMMQALNVITAAIAMVS